jgi:tetratricopeptide (TPR) repeat protein
LKFYGWTGDQFEISNQIKPERADRNVNVEELQFWTRNHAGWLNYEFRVGGDIDLLKEFIANGIPIMIEEGDELEIEYWPNDDRWAGHYLLLTGYDEAAQTFTAQDSYRGADRIVSYAETDERWKAFNRVYIIVYRPDQDALVKSILGQQWDVDFNRQSALDAAQAETEANPQDAYAWFNLGSNLVYFERYADAAQAYDQAREIGLPQRMFRYQFGPFFAYFHANRTEDLMAIVEYSLRITENSEEALVWKGWGLYRQGDEAGAVAAFREAYWANPLSPDAQYALDFMGASP